MRNLLALVLLFFILSPAHAAFFPNARTVHKGNLYRSAQLSKKQFKKYIKKWDIKTIINLRGESTSDWYEDEIAISNEMGVEHHDIKMSAKRLPHRKDILKLIELYENAPRPILIHCHGGADRTGEASAMYKIDFMGASKRKALQMQTVLYLHLRLRFPAKRYFTKEVYQGKEWAKVNYYPCDGNYKYYNTESKECN